MSFLNDNSNPFGLSVGDLMAALLLTFVLLLMATLLKLQKERENVVEIAKEYLETKQKIHEALCHEFRRDTARWDVTIDSNLVVRFKSPNVKFDSESDILKSRFKIILADFFPRYIDVLSNDEFKSKITEIRIEGHTNSKSTLKPEQRAYMNNMFLSQNRTRTTLRYCLTQILDSKNYDWTRKLLTANGLSYSKPILNNNGTEDFESSRRVEFRIRTNAEEKIEEIMKQNISFQ